mmetsp:Transcript_151758/g.486915  ORF Transcript_151758/g.486915 Transcript_151758/m.486915 type:complete len:245 (+) Transcript_151758:642-1376(+)
MQRLLVRLRRLGPRTGAGLARRVAVRAAAQPHVGGPYGGQQAAHDVREQDHAPGGSGHGRRGGSWQPRARGGDGRVPPRRLPQRVRGLRGARAHLPGRGRRASEGRVGLRRAHGAGFESLGDLRAAPRRGPDLPEGLPPRVRRQPPRRSLERRRLAGPRHLRLDRTRGRRRRRREGPTGSEFAQRYTAAGTSLCARCAARCARRRWWRRRREQRWAPARWAGRPRRLVAQRLGGLSESTVDTRP